MQEEIAINKLKDAVITFGGAHGFELLQKRGTIAAFLPLPASRKVGDGRARVEAESFSGTGKLKPIDPTSLRLVFDITADMNREDIRIVEKFLKTSLLKLGSEPLGIDTIPHSKNKTEVSVQLRLNPQARDAVHKFIYGPA